MKRLLKLTLFAAVIAGLVVAARKLMGGLGPQPGDPGAPKEWPSLVPEPRTPEPPTPEASAGNGSAAVDTTPTADEAPGSGEHIAQTGDSGSDA